MLSSPSFCPTARPQALYALVALCLPLGLQAQTGATPPARSTPAPSPVADAEVQLYVGETRLFPAPGVKRIAVGNGQMITANVLDGRDVLVFANAPGVTNMMFWDAAGRMTGMKVTVTANDARGSAKEIASFLATIPNARTSVIGDKVIVEGDNLADRDLAKIDELSKRYPQVVNFTSKLGWEKMIMMDVKVVEFPTNLLRDIGMKWSATGGGAIGGIWAPATLGGRRDLSIAIPGNPSLQGTGTTTAFTDKLNILSALNLGLAGTLNLLVRDGQGSILAEPQLSARNGSKATFLAGGEYPYTVSSINGQTVFFKPFGIKLDIVPQVDKNNMVRAVIDSEVSSLDTSLSTNAGPALSTRRTSTEFNVKAGETMVLAGLLSRKTTSTIDKVPFLGDIPILGALFRSKRFQNDETELVVFVTPTIVDAHTSSLTARVDDATQRLEKDAGKSPYLPAIETRPPANAPQAKANSLPTPALVAPTPVLANSPAAPIAVAAPNPVPAVATPPTPVAAPAAVRATPVASVAPSPAANAAAQVAATERAVAQAAEALAAQRAAAAKPTAADIAAEAAKRAPRNETTPLTGMPVGGDGSLAAGMYRVNQYDLPLRSSAEFDGRILRYLPLNAVVEVLPSGRKGYFVAVKVGEQTGWVGAQWLRAQ